MVISFMSEYLEEEGQRLLEEDQRLKEDPEFKVPDSFVQAGKKAIKRTHRAGKPLHHWTRRLAIIAAVLVIVLSATLVVGAIGFTAEPKWNDEHFTFEGLQYPATGEKTPPNYDNWYEGKEFDSLQEMLDDFGITEISEPKLPKGYGISDVYVYVDEESDILYTSVDYKSEESRYFLSVQCDYIPEGVSPKYLYEKESGDPEVFSDGERTYYLFSNIHINDIVWLTDNYICSISGDVSFDELIKMVESIY